MKKDYTEFDYRAKSEELEAILAQLQSKDIQLDESLRLHQAGKKLIDEIEEFLQYAENQVTKQLAKD